MRLAVDHHARCVPHRRPERQLFSSRNPVGNVMQVEAMLGPCEALPGVDPGRLSSFGHVPALVVRIGLVGGRVGIREG